MKIVNCTPHTVKVFEEVESENQKLYDLIAEFPPSGFVMRLESEKQEPLEPFLVEGTSGTLSIPTVSPQKFKKKDIKWPTSDDDTAFSGEDVVILVSMPVGQLISELGAEIPYHVAGPDTGPGAVVRDDKGQIRGTTRLVYYRKKKAVSRIVCGTI